MDSSPQKSLNFSLCCFGPHWLSTDTSSVWQKQENHTGSERHESEYIIKFFGWTLSLIWMFIYCLLLEVTKITPSKFVSCIPVWEELLSVPDPVMRGAHKNCLSVWALGCIRSTECIFGFIRVSLECENSDEQQNHSMPLQRAVKWNSTVKE